MAAPGKQRISKKQRVSTDVSQDASENHVTFVDEDGKIKVAHALYSIMKAETLQILQQVEKSYRSKLGSRHKLTQEVARYTSNPTGRGEEECV